MIAGLETPDTGDVVISGQDTTGVPPQDRGVGFVFQHYAAFKHMTVRDNVGFGLSIRKEPKAEIRKRVDELLQLVQLDGLAERYPSQLSGGQRQRMALARALAVEPEVLLLDEPFGALDARVRKELRTWLRRLHDDVHVTTVLVTHDQEEAMDVADRIVLMNQGTDRADRQAARPLRASRERVRHVASSARSTGSARTGCARTTSTSASSRTASTSEAMIERIVHLGFEVRVELVLDDGAHVSAQVTRDEAEELELARGPDRVRPAEPDHGVRRGERRDLGHQTRGVRSPRGSYQAVLRGPVQERQPRRGLGLRRLERDGPRRLRPGGLGRGLRERLHLADDLDDRRAPRGSLAGRRAHPGGGDRDVRVLALPRRRR